MRTDEGRKRVMVRKKRNGFKNSNNQRIENKSDSWFLMVELAVFLVHLPIFLVFIVLIPGQFLVQLTSQIKKGVKRRKFVEMGKWREHLENRKSKK